MHRRLPALSVLLGLAALYLLVPAHGQDKVDPKVAVLKVLLPDARATLLVEDKPTKQEGEVRTFESTPLEPGKTYSYTVTATWEPNNYTKITRSKKVEVKAGKEFVVDLRQPDDKFPDKILVRYVPTPMEVVEAMLKMGKVGKDDVVFDLGCGDGRIVVTAVEKYGAKRGVGVDIDPERIKDCAVTAKKAKVEGKVEFRMEDVLKLKDISEANAVMLYMGNDLNLALRPILQKSLKPGSRIVSHRFTMGDWKPDRTETITDKSGNQYQLHLWTIK